MAAALLAVALGGRIASIGGPSTPQLAVNTDPQVRPPTLPTPAAPIGRWRPGAATPRDVLLTADAVWTGDALLSWGGAVTDVAQRPRLLRDGWRWDDRQDRWSALPPAPLRRRHGHALAWTGEALFVWGGAEAGAHLADGALWHRDRGWTIVRPAPLSPRSGALAVAHEGQIFVIGGHDTLGPLRDVVVYDPGTDRWRTVAPLPEMFDRLQAASTPAGPVIWAVSVRTTTGRPRAVVFRYDAERNRWQSLVAARTPAEGDSVATEPLSPPAAVASHGGRLYAVTSGDPGRLFVLDENGLVWQELARIGGVDTSAVVRLVPAERQLFVLSATPLLHGGRYDLATGRWDTLPIDPIGWIDYDAVWTRGSLVVYGTPARAGNDAAGGLIRWTAGS